MLRIKSTANLAQEEDEERHRPFQVVGGGMPSCKDARGVHHWLRRGCHREVVGRRRREEDTLLVEVEGMDHQRSMVQEWVHKNVLERGRFLAVLSSCWLIVGLPQQRQAMARKLSALDGYW